MTQQTAPSRKGLEAPGASVARWWARLSPMPGGKKLFSMLIGRMAPYTGTIGARVDQLEPGYARWTLRDRRAVRNHLRSIHAVALVNLAEVTSGTAMLMTLPPGVRGIPIRLSIEFVKKARGTLTCECRCEIPSVLSAASSIDLRADIRDTANDIVATATVTWRLSAPQ